jgi:hypothetical protein
MGLLLIRQMIYECGQPWWNDVDRVKSKISDRNLSECQFVLHKSRMAGPGRMISVVRCLRVIA